MLFCNLKLINPWLNSHLFLYAHYHKYWATISWISVIMSVGGSDKYTLQPYCYVTYETSAKVAIFSLPKNAFIWSDIFLWYFVTQQGRGQGEVGRPVCQLSHCDFMFSKHIELAREICIIVQDSTSFLFWLITDSMVLNSVEWPILLTWIE